MGQPNRLAKETSPYLLQHAHNPVDWYPWGAEAIQRARFDDKPILLSIGYSACHWCHVMERESFEDAETAAAMNERFVCIKVDREERPDLDSIYMQAVQALTGHGGWPMTVFLTPDLAPFWGGTYFPPTDRPGMPSFRRVLAAVSDAYLQRGDEVEKAADAMRKMYRTTTIGTRNSELGIGAETLRKAADGILKVYDAEFGGFGGAPKFPQAMAMEFLLTHWSRNDDGRALSAVLQTFLTMARGGIYDQVGGGFARYSVDERWLVPHFEKMLYDNALLLRLGVHLFQATKNDEVARVCRDIVRWIKREMTAPSGGFYSTLDADSEGHEGKFYVWDVPELRSLLGSNADEWIAYWGATDGGNFEGRNILHVNQAALPRSAKELESARATLYAARARRVRPARDEKILASWNGLMLRAVVEASLALRLPDAASLATDNARFLLREMVKDGRVFRTHKDGVTRIPGFLEDHAAVALAFLPLDAFTGEQHWFDTAMSIATSIRQLFWDKTLGAFFDTATDHEELVTRPMDVTDNATPSGTSLAIELFLRLGAITGDDAWTSIATRALARIGEPLHRFPLAFGYALTAADMAVHGGIAVTMHEKPDADSTMPLRDALWSKFVPSLLEIADVDRAASRFAFRREHGEQVAYVCHHNVCEAPARGPRALGEALDRAIRPAGRPG